jgi:hypothetical protein
MQITIDITFKERDKDGAKTERTRTFKVDSEDMPLALAEENIAGMRLAIADFLDLTEAESRQITLRHLKAIGKAMAEANSIPNG